MTDTAVETYSSSEVCRLVGISYRQLDYWVRTRKIAVEIAANGSGSRRRWTFEEVRRLMEVVAVWRDAHAILESFNSGALWRSTDELPTNGEEPPNV